MSSSEDEFDPDSDSKRFDPSKIPDLDNLLQGQPLNILFNGRFYGARIKRVTRACVHVEYNLDSSIEQIPISQLASRLKFSIQSKSRHTKAAAKVLVRQIGLPSTSKSENGISTSTVNTKNPSHKSSGKPTTRRSRTSARKLNQDAGVEQACRTRSAKVAQKMSMHTLECTSSERRNKISAKRPKQDFCISAASETSQVSFEEGFGKHSGKVEVEKPIHAIETRTLELVQSANGTKKTLNTIRPEQSVIPQHNIPYGKVIAISQPYPRAKQETAIQVATNAASCPVSAAPMIPRRHKRTTSTHSKIQTSRPTVAPPDPRTIDLTQTVPGIATRWTLGPPVPRAIDLTQTVPGIATRRTLLTQTVPGIATRRTLLTQTVPAIATRRTLLTQTVPAIATRRTFANSAPSRIPKTKKRSKRALKTVNDADGVPVISAAAAAAAIAASSKTDHSKPARKRPKMRATLRSPRTPRSLVEGQVNNGNPISLGDLNVIGHEFDEHILYWTPGTTSDLSVKRNVNCFESAAKYLEWFAPLVLCEMHACMIQIFREGVPNGRSKHRESGSDRLHAAPVAMADYSAVLETRAKDVSKIRNSSHVCVRFNVQQQSGYPFNVADVLLIAHKNDAASVWSKISGEVQRRRSHQTKGSSPGSLHNGIIGIVMKKFPRYCLIKMPEKLWLKFKHRGQRREGDERGRPSLLQCPCWALANTVTLKREYQALMMVNRYRLCHALVTGCSQMESDEEALQRYRELGGKFIAFCEQKFNKSQQRAIRSSLKDGNGFFLVQGPPGTGKTTTLIGMINAVHLYHFTKFHAEVVKVKLSRGKHQDETASGNEVAVSVLDKLQHDQRKLLHSMSKVAPDPKRPRILVAAPSNAAVDLLVKRIMQKQFVDRGGNRYKPTMVRLGRGQDQKVGAVSVLKMAQYYARMTAEERSQSEKKARKVIAEQKEKLRKFRDKVQSIRLALAQQTANKTWSDRLFEIARYDLNRAETDYVSCYGFLNSQEIILQSLMAGKSIEKLQLLQLLNSDIVFTTLSSSGLKLLQTPSGKENTVEAKARRFDLIIVDEAAQSMELSTLIPLRFNCSKMILVGVFTYECDPQQLPATIISLKAKSGGLGRSLFERLVKCGHKVHLLDTQYRMHPEISRFPNSYFYHNQIADGDKVCGPNYMKKICFHFHKSGTFAPFRFFNVMRCSRSSLQHQNPDEAVFVVNLCASLYRTYPSINFQDKIGVITFYNKQKELIRRKLQEHRKQWETSHTSDTTGFGFPHIEVNTVDGFQGREKDIIILSCVRASDDTGVGFVKDKRRMNVALTRAKYSLWVVGNYQTLSQSKPWYSLIREAHKRNSMFTVVHPEINICRENWSSER